MTETTEILDAVRDSLANRNREKDDELATWWAGWIEGHAQRLRTLGYHSHITKRDTDDADNSP